MKPHPVIVPRPEGGRLEDADEPRFSRYKVCQFCTLTRLIPEEDLICKDCWTLRMVGVALVTCPYFLYEQRTPRFPDGKVPVEVCYDCAYRRGWTERLAPVCTHPVAVQVQEEGRRAFVRCPGRLSKPLSRSSVPEVSCKACPCYRGELCNPAGSFVYCSWPRPGALTPLHTGGEAEGPSAGRVGSEPEP